MCGKHTHLRCARGLACTRRQYLSSSRRTSPVGSRTRASNCMRFGTSRWRRSRSGNGRIRADDGLESIDGRPSERFSTVIVVKEVSNGHRGGYRIYFPLSRPRSLNDGPLSVVTTSPMGKRAQHPMSGHVSVPDVWVLRGTLLLRMRIKSADRSISEPTLAVHLPIAVIVQLFHLALMLRIQLPGAPGNSCPHPHIGLAQDVQQLVGRGLYMQLRRVVPSAEGR